MRLYYMLDGKRVDVGPEETARVIPTLSSFTGLDRAMLDYCLSDTGLHIPGMDGERIYHSE